jgi:hypothetical protein
VVTVDAVAVSATDAGRLHVSTLDELGEYPLGGSFGDADALRDVAQPDVRILREAKKDLSVVREEGPGLWFRIGARRWIRMDCSDT